MNSKRVFHCIVAMDSKRGMGKDNKLPWNLPNEFKYFQQTTKKVTSPDKKNALLMGRNTWFSIPEKFRPLKGRLNVVISSKLTEQELPQDVKLAKSLDKAVELLSCEPYATQIENIFITGGNGLYKEAMQSLQCDKIYLTKVKGDFQCDVFYPEWDETCYKEIFLDKVSQTVQEEKGVKYSFHVFARKLTSEDRNL